MEIFMRTFIVPVMLTLVTLAACSGGGATIPDPASGLVDGGSDSALEPDGAGPDATSKLDAAPKPDAAVDTRIDPIEVGRTWTYDVTILGTYPLCRAGVNTARVLGQKAMAGKQGLQVQSFCPGAGTSSYAVDGDRVEVYYGGAWVLSLDAPVADGHTWSDGVVTYVWEKVGKLTVPAGTFDDCWKARPQVGPSYTTFCRGVGPVRWHYVDGLGNGYDATLTATAP